ASADFERGSYPHQWFEQTQKTMMNPPNNPLAALLSLAIASAQEALSCGASSTYEQVSTDNLEALFIFMRHGIRAPCTSYPKDPNVNSTNCWPNGPAQLTCFGIKQATNIGNLLRRRYGSFTRNLKRNQIFLRTSGAQRCIDTLQLVSNRLWPNTAPEHAP